MQKRMSADLDLPMVDCRLHTFPMARFATARQSGLSNLTVLPATFQRMSASNQCCADDDDRRSRATFAKGQDETKETMRTTSLWMEKYKRDDKLVLYG